MYCWIAFIDMIDIMWVEGEGEIVSISHHKIATWIVGFIPEPKGLISRSQLFKASHAKESQPGHCFPRCACSFQNENPLPEKCTIFPRKTTHCCTIASHLAVLHLHVLTMHFLPSSHGIAAMSSSDQICTFLIGRSDFDQSITCTFFQAFKVFVRYVAKIFLPKR